MSTPTSARPIELPTRDSAVPLTPRGAEESTETPAQNRTAPVGVEERADSGEDVPVDHTGTEFELDLGTRAAPIVLFALLTGLSALVVVAAPVLPVQIVAGLTAGVSGLVSIRSLTHRHR